MQHGILLDDVYGRSEVVKFVVAMLSSSRILGRITGMEVLQDFFKSSTDHDCFYWKVAKEVIRAPVHLVARQLHAGHVDVKPKKTADFHCRCRLTCPQLVDLPRFQLTLTGIAISLSRNPLVQCRRKQ